MRVFEDLTAFTAAKGEHLGYSEWHQVTQEQVNLFADATGDHQWIHVDAERAAEGPFGQTIAHGFLTLSLLPVLMLEIFEVKGIKMAVNAGLNRARFPKPVPVGAKVRAGAELVEVRGTPAGTLTTLRMSVLPEGEKRGACIADMLLLLVPEDAQ
ncbi:MaoC family dehydratase [Sinosporangium siamense]|uniref:MaoC family dehydratase n=1 Tax=Sinosporangium siamense TaxID=1367973 RepID=A0A919VCW1_9ACTN|nr:MaoC family dehydratase [Sinosporangium siamense]GII93529.1 MaoC family dehydratase [Sinosporangium siamense]